MIYRLTWWFCRFIFRFVFPREIVGAENVPREGPVIIASNHQSNLDPPLLGTSFWRRTHALAKAELFKNPVQSAYIRSLNAFPVKRGAPDRQALKHCLDLLRDGEVLMVFPEGTRSETGELRRPEPGIGLIISRSGAPVVPAFIENSGKAMSRDGGIRRTPVKISFGPPLHFETASSGKPDYEEIAWRVMEAIAEVGGREPPARVDAEVRHPDV